jgi:S-adenosylmethionine/arginine decarboxylase-like enzyme
MYNYSYWVKETEPNKLKEVYDKLLNESGFNVLKYIDCHFTPYGFTALYLLSESHLAIHTFPEENKSYIELSSCIDKPFYKFKDLLNKDI